jgi:chromosome segregation ATPase
MDAMKAEIDAWKSAAISRWAEAVSVMAAEQELRSQLRALEGDVQQLTVRLHAAEAEVGELQTQIEGLRSSTSWRLTSPIRWATGAIRRAHERM